MKKNNARQASALEVKQCDALCPFLVLFAIIAVAPSAFSTPSTTLRFRTEALRTRGSEGAAHYILPQFDSESVGPPQSRPAPAQ